MAFIDDIKTCLLGDASLNALVTGGIYYEEVPIGADKTKNWIVYDYDRVGSEDTIEIKDSTIYYDLEIQVISSTRLQIKDISERAYKYLKSYTDTRIRDISLSQENKIEKDNEIKLFYKTDIYTVMYEPAL